MTKPKITLQNKTKNSTKKGSIRIIAGQHRGRKLPVIMSSGLRPTTDRIKETVFNWLMPYLPASRCLDCYAGAGSLGFEALSRGASELTLLELDRQVARQLKANITLLNSDNIHAKNVTVAQVDTLQFLQHQPVKRQDIIFVDPPFHQDLIEQTIALLSKGWVAEQSLVYLEMEYNISPLKLPENWLLLKHKVSGQVAYALYQVQA